MARGFVLSYPPPFFFEFYGKVRSCRELCLQLVMDQTFDTIGVYINRYMNEKMRTLMIAGGILVAILAVVVLIPEDAFESNYPEELTTEDIERIRGSIEESERAIEQFEEENREPQVFASEYKILGSEYRRLGELRPALEAYQNALEYVPDDSNAIRSAYDIYIELEDYDGAQTWLSDLIDRDPEEFIYWNLLTELEKEHFDLEGEELEARLREAVDVTNRSVGSLVSLAQYLEFERQEYREALSLWREAAAENPQYRELYNAQIAGLEAKVNENTE